MTSPHSAVRTFLIADVRGYTRFTLDHGDEAAATLATHFAAIATEVIAARDGRVVELRGDEVLAVFDSTRQALWAAVELQRRLASSVGAEASQPVKAGIGLDAGEAVPVGEGFRGVALNLAARLCALAGPGEVLASDAIIHLARKVDGLTYVDRGAATLKGFSTPVSVYRVQPSAEADIRISPAERTDGAAVRPEQSLPIGGYLGALPVDPLVGRNELLPVLRAALDGAEAGAAPLLLIAGEPGVGKTRLAQEVTVEARNRGFVVAAGRCYEPEQTVAYYPFLDALTTLFLLAPPDVQREAGTRWPYLRVLLPDLIGTPEVQGGQDDEQRVFRAVMAFLEALSQVVPIALLLDDVHWADASSLKLLLHLARHAQSTHLLLLATYRDVEVGRQHPLEAALRDLQREGLGQRIAVRRLPQDGTRALIASIMDEAQVGEEFAELVHGRTEGNPYFVQQVLRDLVERGDVYRRDGHWDRKAIDDLSVPESIRSAVGQRLAHLSEGTQEVLHEASALGQTFRFEDVQAMGSHTEEDIEGALEEAMAVAVIQELDSERYGFDHALTQQSLYAELTARRKRRLHLAAGTALEQSTSRKSKERAAEIAWHFLRGDDPERALPYTLQAGEQAEAVFAREEAELQYRTALGLARELGASQNEAEALDNLGRILKLAGRHDEALEALEGAAAIHHTEADLAREVRTVAAIAELHHWRGSQHDGLVRVEAFLDGLDDRHPPPGTARLYYHHLGNAYLARPIPFTDLLAQCERIGPLAQAERDTGTMIFAEAFRGFALRHLGRDEEAVRVLEAIAPLAEEQGTADFIQPLMVLAETYLYTGRLEQARMQLTDILAVSERWGDSNTIAACVTHVGDTYFASGDWRQARNHYERALQIREADSRSWSSGFPLVRLGELAFREGRWAEAEQLLDAAMILSLENQDAQWLSLIHDLLIERDVLRGRVEAALARHQRVLDDSEQAVKLRVPSPSLGMLALARGDFDQADNLVESALQFWGREGLSFYTWIWIALQARTLAARQRWEESEAAFQGAIARVRRTRYVFYEAQALQWHGEMLAARGEFEQARQRLQEAHEIYAHIGAAPYLAQTDAALEALAEQQTCG
jgi:class 3 adenylate cyclase/tetratricopeptide (TPR) repeat protein